MPHPEGYRKALRLMKLAEKFHVPVLTFIDTPGAWAGLGAEERGQSEAIARNLFEMSQLQVPIIATVIGEGGSGGALALGVADRVLMLENSVYSVITVEGCAAILWKDGKSPEMREKAASALRITAPDLLELRRDRRDHPRARGRRARQPRRRRAPRCKTTLVQQLDELRSSSPTSSCAGGARSSCDGPVRRVEPCDADGRHLHRSRLQGQPQGVLPLGRSRRRPRARRARRSSRPTAARTSATSTATGELAEQRCSRCRARPRATATPLARSAAPRHASDEISATPRAARARTRRRAARRWSACKANSLAMKLTDAEWQWDRRKLTFYFTAEKRVDFRTLVRELAAMFRTRIELKQIGVRDEAKRLDGIGRCGRAVLLGVVAPRAAAGEPRRRQGPEALAQPDADLRRVRPPDVLPALRARVLRAAAQALPQGRQDHRRRRRARRRSSPTTSSASA